jgi:hypothetical protein
MGQTPACPHWRAENAVSSAILNITFDCADPRALARFWGRLSGLGATIVSDRRPESGWVILADPEGNEFCVEISVGELESAQAATAAT